MNFALSMQKADTNLPCTTWVGRTLTPTLAEHVVMSNSSERDAFFTKPEVAEKCIDFLENYLSDLSVDIKNYTLLEPSAGSGAFSNPLMESWYNVEAIDIKPLHDNIGEQDFLTWQPSRGRYIAIGNVPFGKNGVMAELFFKRLANVDCHFVAFILPMGFAGDVIPKRLAKTQGWHLQTYLELDNNAFTFENSGKDYKCNTVFCIYGRNKPMQKQNGNECSVEFHTIYLEDEPQAKQKNIDKIPECQLFLQTSFGKGNKDIYFSTTDGIKTNRVIGVQGSPEAIEHIKSLPIETITSKQSAMTTEQHICFFSIKKLRQQLVNAGFVKGDLITPECSADVFIFQILNKKAGMTKCNYDKGLTADIHIASSFSSGGCQIFTEAGDTNILIKGQGTYISIIFANDDKTRGIEFIKNYDWASASTSRTSADKNLKTLTAKQVKQALIDNGFIKHAQIYDSKKTIKNHARIFQDDKAIDCDIYIQRNYFHSEKDKDYSFLISVDDVFEGTKIGLRLLKQKQEIIDYLKSIDLTKYARQGNLADHGGTLAGFSHGIITRILIDGGFYDVEKDLLND